MSSNDVPLRDSQRKMLRAFTAEYAKTSISNLHFAIKTDKSIDMERASQALRSIYNIQEILRLQIRKTDGQFVQFCEGDSIAPNVIRHVSSTNLDGESYARSLIYSPMVTEEDFLASNLSKVFIVENPSYNIIGLAVSHVLTDAAGVSLMRSYFLDILTGKRSPKYYAVGSYLEYVTSEAEWLQSKEAASKIDYWCQIFDNYDVPKFFPTNDEINYAGISFDITATSATHLQAELFRMRNTLFSGLIATFAYTLLECGKMSSIAVRTAVSGRTDNFTRLSFGSHINNVSVRFLPPRENGLLKYLPLSASWVNDAIRQHATFGIWDKIPGLPTTTDIQFVYNDRSFSISDNFVKGSLSFYDATPSIASPLQGTNCKLRLHAYPSSCGLNLILHYNPSFISRGFASELARCIEYNIGKIIGQKSETGS